jgi:hypothetical protein
MKRTIAVTASVALLLAGCANPATQQQLNANNAACAAGDPDACTAAQFTAQKAQAEAAQNANAVLSGVAVLGAAGAVAAAANNSGGTTYYVHTYHPHRGYQ